MLLELRQAWCCDHFREEPVPVPNHPLSEEPFSNIQPKPPLTSGHSLRSGHQREEISVCSFSSLHKEVVDCYEVSPQSPLLQAEHTKCDGLTLAEHQVPAKAILSLLLLNWTVERKYNERLLGQDQERERSLTHYHHGQNRFDLGKQI
ncbi:hypothetical protein BTVI_29591 [Pitangus sulphuratus]|nr:hypothetical protein BTVI_29591 [Pitangus sulphuratus]